MACAAGGRHRFGKKYLYIVRAVLAAGWVLSRKTPPPVEFSRLLSEALTVPEVRECCGELVAGKAGGQESCIAAREPVLDAWLSGRFQALRVLNATIPARVADLEVIDTFFRHCLGEVWRVPAA